MNPADDEGAFNELARTTALGESRLPGYELLSVLGRGGFGTVYKARQVQLDRIVAVKVVEVVGDGGWDAPGPARFVAEARTHGKLHHPNIVEVYDSGRFENRLFIAMELLEGQDLAERIKDGPVPERVAWAIARQVASALSYAADASLVHRDIKPANLYLSQAPAWSGLPPSVPLVRVTDFGLAMCRGPDGLIEPNRTEVCGTPLYMAPEQHKNPRAIDHRADIFALGATIAHALTGRPPFKLMMNWERLQEYKVQNGLDLGPGVSAPTAALLRAMTAGDPTARPSNYSDLIARIDRLAAAGDIAPWPADPPKARRRRWRLALIPVAVALAVGGAGLLRRTAPEPRYEQSGTHLALFDGASLQEWLPPGSGGAWRLDLDNDGEPVMVGTGFARRAFQPTDSYRVTVGLDVKDGGTVDIHFALKSRAPDVAPRLVLRVSRTEGAVFGHCEGDKGAFSPRGEPVPYPTAEWFRDRKPYTEVRVERLGSTWLVWFNGTRAGRVADDGAPKAAEIRLRATGAPSTINSAFFTPLQPF